MDSSIFDKLRAGVVTGSAEESRSYGRLFGAALPANTVIAFHGNLGVGKTTFIQGLASGLGIKESITSPTFNIFTLHSGGRMRLVHLDAYRLEGAHQIEDLMLEDFLVSPWCLAVEWPEKIAEWIPADAIHLELGITPEEHHTIRLCSSEENI